MSSKPPRLPIDETLVSKRHIGAKGTPILMHRSLWNLPLDSRTQYTILFLPLLFDVIIWLGLENIIQLWTSVFRFWMEAMELGGRITTLGVELPWGILDMPFPDLPVALPSNMAVWINLIACLIIIIVSRLFSSRFLPLTFTLRFMMVIQLTASIYFLISPDYFPYTLGTYITQCLTLGVYLLLLIPPVLSMIYYVFDVPFSHKCLLTALVLSYFIIVLPFQYLLHALIISRGSLLFMPTLYIFFSFLLNIFIFISLYSWAMTWHKG